MADETLEEGAKPNPTSEQETEIISPETEPTVVAAAEAELQEIVEAEEQMPASKADILHDNLSLLMDISLEVTVEIGRKEMRFGEILQLAKGSLIELNKLADGPVDILVNRSKVAEGDVVVIDEHFGVRITKVLSTQSLQRTG
ncbi:flagellar motor switch protein FliN [bacterium]|nr:flagellar motor switch protein FliN [bacterium]